MVLGVRVLLGVCCSVAFAFGSVFVRNKLKMKMKIFEIEIPNAAEQNAAAKVAPTHTHSHTRGNTLIIVNAVNATTTITRTLPMFKASKLLTINTFVPFNAERCERATLYLYQEWLGRRQGASCKCGIIWYNAAATTIKAIASCWRVKKSKIATKDAAI